jgi:hypothetical protein
MSREELKASSDAKVQAFFVKKEPEPKPVYTEKAKNWAHHFLTQPPQFRMHLSDDYECKLVRQANLEAKKKDLMKKQPSKKSGNQIPQLGE